uniref:ATP synthase-coupling factor 6, mitochondrial n=1 Tax=Globodera rostochiensis TaxID=31243 RepID=A0A914GV60_GLORO
MASFRGFLVRRVFSTSDVCMKADLVTNAYLSKIREVVGKQSDLLETSPEIKKQLGEQLNRLANKFNLPDADAVTKLNFQFESANVVSSVDALTETVDEQLKALKESRAIYEAEQADKKRAEQERLTSMSGDSDYANDFFPIPPPHIEAQQLAAAASKSTDCCPVSCRSQLVPYRLVQKATTDQSSGGRNTIQPLKISLGFRASAFLLERQFYNLSYQSLSNGRPDSSRGKC